MYGGFLKQLRRGCAFALALFWLTASGPGAAPADAVPPVRLVFADKLPPLSFLEDGLARGILIDIAGAIFRSDLGLAVEIELYPWERAQEMVRQGEADGFITIATPARRAFADCGALPVLRAPLHPLVRRDHPARRQMEQAGSLADLRQFSFVSYRGNGWAKTNLQAPGFDVFFAADYTAHLKGLAQGRGDLALVTATTGGYYLSELGLADKLVLLPPVIDIFEYVLCLGKESPHRARLAEFEAALGRKRGGKGYVAILEAYGLTPSTPY
ncbi:MAG: substrate-binding periplasmic protein [Oceanibaculum sp.]|jgi:polar amino acid transport system substrate-binding protein